MSSVFGTGQSMNSMARIMKASQMSKVCASSHEYPHVDKIFVNKISKVRWPNTLTAKELTSRQIEKPHSKQKNLRQKEKHFLFFFLLPGKRKKNKKCPEVFLFAVRFFFVFLFALWFFFLP